MSAKSPKTLSPRKLLVAAVGVATINYVGMVACDHGTTSGNLPAPRDYDANQPPPTSGNLPAPQPIEDAGTDADAGKDGG